MKNKLDQFVERSFLPTDDADLRRKKIALTLVPMIIGLAAFVWGLIYCLLGHYLSGSIPMSYAIISLASLIYFFKTKETQFLQNSQLVLVLLLPFLLMWSLGGFFAGSMVMIWAIFAPVAALMFLDKRSALMWFIFYIMMILVSVLIDNYVSRNVTPLPELARSLFFILNLGCASAGLFLLLSYEFSAEKRANEADLRIAASAFETQESLMITDVKRVILRVNKAFLNETGYTQEEIVGQTPRIFKSGHHDKAFYIAMWKEINRTGSWQGEIWDRRKNGEIYPKWLSISAVKDKAGIVTNYVSSHIDITERKSAEEKIHQMAFHDPLTRLPNRLLLLDRLQQTLASGVRSGRNGALLFIDLDNFKIINDTLGHFMGDLLLQQVAERLVVCVREDDTVARLGGDEFVVMLKELSEQPIEAAEQVEVVGEKILAALRQPYLFDNLEFKSTASIDVTVFSGNHEDSEELLKQADIAMYQGKKAGRDSLYYFDPQMQETINHRVKLERELHKALELGQFQLYFQIQVSGAQTDGSILPLGAEVLIRWKHPERGMVSPAQFIPLAEETGLIVSIGQWVLDTACAQLKTWEGNEATRNLLLAVNVSPLQFRQKNLVKQLKATIGRHAINHSLLKLELTENLLLEDIEETVAIMNELKEIGVRLSLDDFGTGYSSLQYLKLLPLDQIKIDQSFVRDITTDQNDAAIVQTIIAMSELLGLKVIAEGVETEMQREFLSLRGCNTFQGYLFGKPMPIDKFEAHLNMSGVHIIEHSMSAWDYRV